MPQPLWGAVGRTIPAGLIYGAGFQPLMIFVNLPLARRPISANLSHELIDSRPRSGKMNVGRPFKAGKRCEPRTASHSDG